jgi:hypothetical protein
MLAQKRARLHLLKSLESDPHKRAQYDVEMQDFKDALNFVTGCCIGKVQDYVKPKLRTTKEEEQLGVRDCSRADGRGWQLFGETVVTYTTSSAKDYKPRPVGVTVRDRALVRIKWFFYNVLRPAFPGCRLLYTDCDSLFIQVDGDAFATLPSLDPTLFDFSDFPRDHPLFNEANRKKPGCLSLDSKLIKEMTVHGAKRYEILYEDKRVIKNSGIAQHVKPSAEQTAAVAARIDRERKDPKLQWTSKGYVPFGYLNQG